MPSPKKPVAWADDAQVMRAGFKHGRVGAKQAQPCVGKHSRPQADTFGHGKRHGSANPGGLERTLALARAYAGADHCHQRRAEAKHQRHQQVFKP